jgi:hypothetical protein
MCFNSFEKRANEQSVKYYGGGGDDAMPFGSVVQATYAKLADALHNHIAE